MQQTVTVPLIRSFEHQGRYVAAGESITVSPIEALALARRGVVSLDRSRQTYMHRAMVAETVELQPEPEQPKRRRRRRRKDADE